MNQSNPKLMLAGSVWLATALGLPVQAQDKAAPEAGQAAAEPASLPPANGPAQPESAGYVRPNSNFETNCPPRRLGPVARWRQRCRAHAQDSCWGYPEEFQDAPLGAMLQAHLASNIASGQAARMVLHQYDFMPASDQLKPRGKAQVAKIAGWAARNPFLIFVEPSGSGPELDEARRLVVWRELGLGPCPVPSDRVVVGYGASNGLEGMEALAIDRNRQTQTTARGVGSGVASPTSGTAPNTGGGASTGSTSPR